jgi:hypothetical protein
MEFYEIKQLLELPAIQLLKIDNAALVLGFLHRTFKRTGWRLIFDGKNVSLLPSIGSWNLPCQSHYFITKNKAVRAPRWTKKQIARGRVREDRVRKRYYAKTEPDMGEAKTTSASLPATTKPNEGDAFRREHDAKLLVEQDQRQRRTLDDGTKG